MTADQWINLALAIANIVVAFGAVFGIFTSIKALRENREQKLENNTPQVKFDSLSYKIEYYDINYDENGDPCKSSLVIQMINVGTGVAVDVNFGFSVAGETGHLHNKSRILNGGNHIEPLLGLNERVDVSLIVMKALGRATVSKFYDDDSTIRRDYINLDLEYHDVYKRKYRTEYLLRYEIDGKETDHKGDDFFILRLELIDYRFSRI